MIRIHFLAIFLLAASFVQAQELARRYSLIPYPTSLTATQGEFVVNTQTALVVTDTRLRAEANQLNLLVQPSLGKLLTPRGKGTQIVLQYDPTIFQAEGYAFYYLWANSTKGLSTGWYVSGRSNHSSIAARQH